MLPISRRPELETLNRESSNNAAVLLPALGGLILNLSRLGAVTASYADALLWLLGSVLFQIGSDGTGRAKCDCGGDLCISVVPYQNRWCLLYSVHPYAGSTLGGRLACALGQGCQKVVRLEEGVRNPAIYIVNRIICTWACAFVVTPLHCVYERKARFTRLKRSYR